MANGRGLKIGNEYAAQFGKLYAETPKAVFAAVALSLAHNEAGDFEWAVRRVIGEWRILHENGIVPQQPPTKEPASV